MFDTSGSFIKIFTILIAIAFLIYRFQVIMMIIDGFRNWKQRKEKYEADKAEFSRLPDELDELINKKYNHNSDKSSPPKNQTPK